MKQVLQDGENAKQKNQKDINILRKNLKEKDKEIQKIKSEINNTAQKKDKNDAIYDEK